MLRRNKLFWLSMSLLFAPVLQAETLPYLIVAPQCLVKQVNGPYNILSQRDNLALIKTNDIGLEQLISAKKQQTSLCGGFKNITYSKTTNVHSMQLLLEPHIQPIKKPSNPPSAYDIHYSKQTKQLIKKVSPQHMWRNLTTLTEYKDRYADSDNGVKAAAWIKKQVEMLARKHNQSVSVYYVDTGVRFKQPSVVAKIGDSKQSGIVIGGHIDTLSSRNTVKPGADDDGTGAVTVLEVARVLLTNKFKFEKPIYLIWYAAEEEGLIGSQAVVEAFQKKKIAVDAAMQLDMTGYAHHNDPTLWLISDYTNKKLTQYMKKLVSTYVKRPVKETECGYACSDHASWDEVGIPAVMPFEAKDGYDNPTIHTENDKMDLLSLDHMTDFAKLAVAFAIEMARPVS